MSHSRNNNHFNEVKSLKTKPNAKQATELLARLASNVLGIMDYYNWKVGILSEFYPKNKAIYGLNMNHGQKIFIRLRSPTDENIFLDYDTILHTMLHELCHNNHGNHSAAFYTLLDELSTKVIKNGPIITSSSSSSSTVISEDVKKKIKEAAIKRSKTNSIMKNSGNTLGGSMVGIKLSKEQLKINMANAAERRNKDNLWCPSNDETNSNDNKVGTIENNQTSLSVPLDIMWECDLCGEINTDSNISCIYCDIKRDNKSQKQENKSVDITINAPNNNENKQRKRQRIDPNNEINIITNKSKSNKKNETNKDNNIIDLTLDNEDLCLPCE